MEDKRVLTDCGFFGEKAQQYAEAIDAANYSRQLVLLKEQRMDMLNEMHTAARKVDCIDFLICECKKRIKGIKEAE